FYGIEINDFAVSVANAALWIADHQANQETAKIFHRTYVNLPLQDYLHIVVGNALRMDWNDVLPASECNYIMGNPPFLGAKFQSGEQRAEVASVAVDVDGKAIRRSGTLDYVAAWYFKAAQYMYVGACAAFVSTNSICQGEAVAPLWNPILNSYGMCIDFAHRTFNWTVDHANAAAVHCVIVGISCDTSHLCHSTLRRGILTLQMAPTAGRKRIIYDGDEKIAATNINGYLLDAPSVHIESRSRPISDVPGIGIGNKPIDGGNYLFTADERDDFIAKEPASAKWFRPWIGAHEFINGYTRFCLWLGDCPPNELRQMPEAMKLVENVRELRLASKSAPTRRLAAVPTRFHVENFPDSDYIIVPSVSSERRLYLPIGIECQQTIASNLVLIIPNDSTFRFGILTSQFHNAWIRVVAGRLKSDYRYSAGVVYNNFVWPEPTDEQRTKIEELAKAVLDARDNYPDGSLADLYDPLTMPPNLLRAHQALDKAVEQAYGVNFRGDETKIVSHLFNLYSQATENRYD
ncbi:MAG: hypothetical protein FWD93_01085, partial [Coriobacteriia bacterium]|nr:hypothetical protein [Coriobacteriia bacterium]